MTNYQYSCWETCKMSKPCGNVHCSANPHYVPPKQKKKKKDSAKQS